MGFSLLKKKKNKEAFNGIRCWDQSDSVRVEEELDMPGRLSRQIRCIAELFYTQ